MRPSLSSKLRAWPLAAGAIMTAVSCTGSIGEPGPSGSTPGNNASTGPGGGSGSGSTGGPGGGVPGKPASGIIPSSPGPSSRFLRLNHLQWENTVRDLFRLPQITGLSQNFLAEPSLTTFNNAGGSYEVSSQLWVQYRRAADALAKMFSQDSMKLASLMAPGAPADPEGRARAFIRDFGKRAYRRPLANTEIEQYVTLFKQGPTLVASGDAFADGIGLVISTILQSPYFIYRTEFGTGTVTNGKILLDDYEIASRLSYALGNTMPDDGLLALADDKQLHTNGAVLNEAKRLLDSPAAQATIGDFYNQLFREVDPSDLMRDPALVPAFIQGEGLEMKHERELFVNEVIFKLGGGLRELFTAPFTFVNKDLAPLYGLMPPTGTDWTKVDLNPAQRGGLYTQLGFLSRTANDLATRPIIRGVHINRHLLCAAVPDPPPNVNTMVPPNMGPITNRQLFEMLTSPTQCQACHTVLINPLGFAFENYDNLGRYRTKEGNDLTINAAASYGFKGGRKDYNDAVDLMKIIAESDEAHDCYAQSLFGYVSGRDAEPSSAADTALVAEIASRSKQTASVTSMILDLVSTDSFIYRLP